MDEEITIIDSNARNERIINFFINNKKKLILTVSIILVIIIGYLSFEKSKERTKIKLANQYNLALIDLNPGNKKKLLTK
jgi:predicted negative regulator of RcsB-dependent stress response